jgi:hypothetical protein
VKKYLAAMTCAIVIACTVASNADELTLSGIKNVKLIDSGSFVVSGLPPFAREETFEFLQRPDGGITLLSATTMTSGSYRVQARYDYDADWNALRGEGRGIYEDEPVRINLRAQPGAVSIRVRGEKTTIDETVSCPDGCFMDMAPSGSPMFVMTRRYDRDKGGMQSFRWAGQDLRQPLTTPDEQQAALRLRREIPVQRTDGTTITILDYEMIERIPTPDGGVFVMEFDLWTDADNRPMGYRINKVGGKPSTSGILGFRKGYEDVRDQVAPEADSG